MASTKPKTESDYHALANQRGFVWIGSIDGLSVNRVTFWRCTFGHEWKASYANIRKGWGCPHCSGKARKTRDDYDALARASGYEFIGDHPPSTQSKTLWRCSLGHEWRATYQAIDAGHGCHECAAAARRQQAEISRNTEEDYRNLATARGFIWLGNSVTSVFTKTEWQCVVGHRWLARYNDIKQGNGCPFCAGKARKTELDYHIIAFKKGYSWVGSPPTSVADKTEWCCDQGHHFLATYSSLKRGRGCYICSKRSMAKKLKLKALAYRLLAKKRQLEWIGTLPDSTKDKTLWRCAHGHEFEASYGSVKGSANCPVCIDVVNGSRVSQPQRALHELTGGELNHVVQYGKNKRQRYALDIALCVDGTLIDVEYDCQYWHGRSSRRDSKRDSVLIEMGWRILRIKTLNQIPTRSQLKRSIRDLCNGVSYAEIILPDWKP